MNTMTNNLRTYGLKVISSDGDALSSKAVCPFLLEGKTMKQFTFKEEDVSVKGGIKMITVKVTFQNNDNLITGINTNLSGAIKYYVGKWFNLGSVKDNMQKAVKVELI